MRIKRLELQGFKSFKDKTVIHFDSPITGIVGPNGSGKSNIVDAFFWVMGEQSYKHIRSSGSDDIIFKGSSKYAPLGLAEATLVMEEAGEDSKEVSVTRRVYRSGEGEYFMNGSPARLKDIQELFLDTGVGAKGYSVIEQGQIDKVVNSKPEDRRQLIEDAAGIAKYKARKKESLRKLESADVNLARLNDVLKEIEKNLDSLERQAQRAKRHKEIKTELVDKETAWAKRKLAVLRVQYELAVTGRDRLEQELIGLRAELSRNEIELETARARQLDLSKEQETVQNEAERLSADLNHHRNALELSLKRQEDLKQRLAQLNDEKSEIEVELETRRVAVDTLETGNAADTANVARLQEELLAVESVVRERRLAHDQARSEVQVKRNRLDEVIRESTQMLQQVAALKERAHSAEESVARATSELQSLLTQRDEFGMQSDRLASEVVDAEEQLSAVQAEVAGLKPKLSALSDQRASVDREFQKERDRLYGLKARLASLVELDQAREGLDETAKEALQKLSAKGVSAFVLSDFFQVGSNFELAAQAVLSAAFNRILSSLSVSEVISSLTEEGAKGRVEFQFLATDSKIENRSGTLAEFIGFVTPPECDPKIAQLCHAVLSQIASRFQLVQAIDSTSGFAQVTANGEVFDPESGVLAIGGARSLDASSVLGRRRAIHELQTEVAELSTRVDQIESTKEALELQQKELQNSELQLQEDQRERALKLELLRRDASSNAKSFERISKDVSDRESAISRLAETARAATESLVELETNGSALIQERKDLDQWIAENASGAEQQNALLQESEKVLQDARLAWVQSSERLAGQQRQLEGERRFLQDLMRREAELTRLLDQFVSENEDTSSRDEGNEEQVARLTHELAASRAALAQLRNENEIVQAAMTEKLATIKRLHHDGDQKTTQLGNLGVDSERIHGEISHLVQNQEEKYGIGCLESATHSDEQTDLGPEVVTQEMSEEDERALHEEVEELKEKLRRLGEVNPNAIVEFEETQNRHLILQTERNDLLKSMDDLRETIEHINKTSVERFEKAFHAIATRFEKLFPIIFGGGQARLSLVYPEGSKDILEAGVDILAQPPGKKISNMNLLSGGEKALTAISLIFAIFMVKPSPFCILDEVDAPLDDSNIGKFNALVREMSVKSQFILVTHNKKTMELNDALYGVTMEEPGVSKMVSIQMH
jgi:chromosome segregation protein